MKLHKALKKRKSLIGEITKIKELIKTKNSYLEGSTSAKKYEVHELDQQLMSKITELTGIKFAINLANAEIQAKIYILSEYKALIAFWKEVDVDEGAKVVGYSDAIRNYVAQYDEHKRDSIVNEFQLKVDAIQEEIDVYNYNTDFPWDEVVEEKEISNEEAKSREELFGNGKEACGCDKGKCCGHDDAKDVNEDRGQGDENTE